MNVQTIIDKTVAVILPCLPLLQPLVKDMASETAKTLGEKLGEKSLSLATALWEKITNKNQKHHEEIIKKAKDVADYPNDTDYQAILSKALVKQLEASPELANEITKLLNNDHDLVVKMVAKSDSRIEDIEFASDEGSLHMEATKSSSIAKVKIGKR